MLIWSYLMTVQVGTIPLLKSFIILHVIKLTRKINGQANIKVVSFILFEYPKKRGNIHQIPCLAI